MDPKYDIQNGPLIVGNPQIGEVEQNETRSTNFEV